MYVCMRMCLCGRMCRQSTSQHVSNHLCLHVSVQAHCSVHAHTAVFANTPLSAQTTRSPCQHTVARLRPQSMYKAMTVAVLKATSRANDDKLKASVATLPSVKGVGAETTGALRTSEMHEISLPPIEPLKQMGFAGIWSVFVACTETTWPAAIQSHATFLCALCSGVCLTRLIL